MAKISEQGCVLALVPFALQRLLLAANGLLDGMPYVPRRADLEAQHLAEHGIRRLGIAGASRSVLVVRAAAVADPEIKQTVGSNARLPPLWLVALSGFGIVIRICSGFGARVAPPIAAVNSERRDMSGPVGVSLCE